MARLGLIDRLIRATLGAAKWLSLPIALTLFLQWPLRDIVQTGSRLANDIGQIAFALFVACAVVAATRARRHIATGLIADRYGAGTQRVIERLGIAIGLLPWIAFIAWAAAPVFVQTVRLAERFPDTANPGYFLVKLALGLLLILVLLQAILDFGKPPSGRAPKDPAP